MTDETKPDLAPPAADELPQGAQAFIAALSATYEAVGELFAPYQRHPGIARSYDQVMIKLREAGLWVNDSLNMMLNPKLFQAPKPPEGEDAPTAEG